MDATMPLNKPLPHISQPALLKLKAAMRPWQHIRSTMPLQYVVSFLWVASYPGRSVQEYADLAGVGQTTMSRHLLDLGPRNRHMDDGFNLLKIALDPRDMRRHIVTLTPVGEKLARELSEIMEG
jgi:hypothetical protein